MIEREGGGGGIERERGEKGAYLPLGIVFQTLPGQHQCADFGT